VRGRQYLIGALSTHSGVNIETIRYYERIALMPRPPRTQGRHRIYDVDHLKGLTFIRRSRELGFSIAQIRSLLGLEHGQSLTCAEVNELAKRHIADIRSKVNYMKRLQRVLTRAVSP
jgi:MerR family mercuric resistance operon transcriptional regulator